MHRSLLRDAREFAGKDLLLLGSSYSAEDSGSQCWKYGAKSITVAYRNAPMGFNWPDNWKEVPKLERVDENTAYFADGTLYDKFLSHETVSLAFPIIDIDHNTYYFTIPAFKVSSDPIAPAGIDQDVMETMEFTAFRDAATKCMIQIDRFSSTSPITAL